MRRRTKPIQQKTAQRDPPDAPLVTPFGARPVPHILSHHPRCGRRTRSFVAFAETRATNGGRPHPLRSLTSGFRVPTSVPFHGDDAARFRGEFFNTLCWVWRTVWAISRRQRTIPWACSSKKKTCRSAFAWREARSVRRTSREPYR